MQRLERSLVSTEHPNPIKALPALEMPGTVDQRICDAWEWQTGSLGSRDVGAAQWWALEIGGWRDLFMGMGKLIGNRQIAKTAGSW